MIPGGCKFTPATLGCWGGLPTRIRQGVKIQYRLNSGVRAV